MNHDELRDRLRRIDPVPDEVAMESPTSAPARARLEQIMNTDTATHYEPVEPDTAPRRTRTPWLLVGAAAIVLVVGLLAVTLTDGDGGNGSDVAGPPLELSLGAADSMASCLPVDADVLAGMPTAFAGTATAVDDDVVELEVDRWYAGDQVATVQLRSGSAHPALIAGFEFSVGDRYLVSATDGKVNFCGFSGPATPELSAIFDEAFTG